MGQRVPLVDGHCMCHTVTGIEHDTGGAAGGIQGQDSLKGATTRSACGCGGVAGAATYLDGHVHGGHVEGLEHDLHLVQGLVAVRGDAAQHASSADLGHLLPVRLGVQRRLCQQHWVLLCAHAISKGEAAGEDMLAPGTSGATRSSL
jgi:hypothetical protein